MLSVHERLAEPPPKACWQRTADACPSSNQKTGLHPSAQSSRPSGGQGHAPPRAGV